MMVYCVDDRHGSPCPLPCAACDECEEGAVVAADNAAEAARLAGWDEDYIAQMPEEVRA